MTLGVISRGRKNSSPVGEKVRKREVFARRVYRVSTTKRPKWFCSMPGLTGQPTRRF